MDDSQLLSEYVERRSQEAFTRLVERYTGLVYSAALRQVRDPHLAEEVTQAAFLALAKRARQLRREVALSAWLLVTTRFLAINALKAEGRRIRHEREAARMAKTVEQSIQQSDWDAISPHLDAALASLGAQDRRLIALRYFEGLSLEEVAARLSINPAAARQRVHRAVIRMRGFFGLHGINAPLAALGPAILSHAIHPAPSGLATMVAKVALTGKSTMAVLEATKGAILVMSDIKLKTAAVALVVLLLSSGAVVAWKAVVPPSAITRVLAAARQQASNSSAPWQKRFNEVYGLADGQLIKQVLPPMIPERQIYWDTQSNGRSWTLSADSFIFQWDGVSPRWATTSIFQSDLGMVLHAGLRIPRWQVDSSVPQDLRFPGDWVIRKGAAVEEVMAKLAPIVSQRLGRPVHFELKPVTCEAIIVRGSFHFVPLPGMANDGVVRLVDGKSPGKLRYSTSPGTFSELLEKVQSYTGHRVFNESSSGAVAVRVADPQFPQDAQRVVENIAAQTSLRFDLEPREMKVWVMVSGTGPATLP